MAAITFSAEIIKMANMDAAYICIPDDVHKKLGGKRRMKVKAIIEGETYRGSIVDMGLGMMLGITQEIRKKIMKNPGDIIRISIEPDMEERTVEIPEDLQRVLDSSADAQNFFKNLSYTNKKEYCRWITDAKKAETRTSRLEKIIPMLLNGKKNPSEK